MQPKAQINPDDYESNNWEEILDRDVDDRDIFIEEEEKQEKLKKAKKRKKNIKD